MFKAKEYWENRYATGGDSGAGTKGDLLSWKASVVNRLIAGNGLRSGFELGSGDGNFASSLNLEKYVGYDISESAVRLANEKFVNPEFKTSTRQPGFWRKFDITMSIDVIYHIVEERDFTEHMTKLFSSSTKFVVIYSYPAPPSREIPKHIKFNDFVKWAKRHATDWQLHEHLPNKFPFDVNNQKTTSESEFFIFKKK